MRTITPWINFNGNAEEAFTFYKSVFGGEFAKIIRFRDLSGAESGADHKIIREGGEAFEIEDDDIRRLLFLRGADGRANVRRNRILSCRHR